MWCLQCLAGMDISKGGHLVLTVPGWLTVPLTVPGAAELHVPAFPAVHHSATAALSNRRCAASPSFCRGASSARCSARLCLPSVPAAVVI